jgi:hypothetical protein
MNDMYEFQINGEKHIRLNYKIYFDETDKQLAFFIFNANDLYLNDLVMNQHNLKIKIIPGNIISFFIIDTTNYKYAFDLSINKDIIEKMISDKHLEIGVAFKNDEILLNDLCFVIDY